MKIAVIADIHGNLDALEAVLADIEPQAPDLIVNLGDSLSSPLLAGETADRLMPLDLPTVRGNHDRALVDRPYDEMGDWEQPALRQMSEAQLQWVRDMPTAMVVAQDVYMCHATPLDDDVMWTETLLDSGHFTLRPKDEIEKIAEGLNYPVLLCGHSHIQRSVMLSGNRLIVNPGSVGCPGFTYFKPIDHKLESAVPFACYAFIDKTDAGWQPTFRQVRYDTSRVVALAREQGAMDWASVLETGWVL